MTSASHPTGSPFLSTAQSLTPRGIRSRTRLTCLLERRDVDLGNRSVALPVRRIDVAYGHPELGAVQRDGQGHGLRARVGRRPTEVASGCRIVLARADGVLA